MLSEPLTYATAPAVPAGNWSLPLVIYFWFLKNPDEIAKCDPEVFKQLHNDSFYAYRLLQAQFNPPVIGEA